MDSIEKRIQRLREQLGGGNDWMLTVILRDGSRQRMDLPDCFYLVMDHAERVERIEGQHTRGGIFDMMNTLIAEAKPGSGKEPK